jgi:predicted small secreted protein
MVHRQIHTRAVPTELSWLCFVTALVFLAVVLSGCNTVEGMGKDVSAAGGAMSTTAQDVEEKM